MPIVIAHGGLGGPLDVLLELGVPVLAFAGLWWWSTRGDRRGRREAERRRAAGDPAYYASLSTADLTALKAKLAQRSGDQAAAALVEGVTAELARRPRSGKS